MNNSCLLLAPWYTSKLKLWFIALDYNLVLKQWHEIEKYLLEPHRRIRGCFSRIGIGRCQGLAFIELIQTHTNWFPPKHHVRNRIICSHPTFLPHVSRCLHTSVSCAASLGVLLAGLRLRRWLQVRDPQGPGWRGWSTHGGWFTWRVVNLAISVTDKLAWWLMLGNCWWLVLIWVFLLGEGST